MLGAITGDYFGKEDIRNISHNSILIAAVSEGIIQSYNEKNRMNAAIKQAINFWEQKYNLPSYQKERCVMTAAIPGWLYFKLPEVEEAVSVLAETLAVSKMDQKAMQIVAAVIFFCRQEMDKKHLCRYIERKIEISEENHFQLACSCFMKGESFEEILQYSKSFQKDETYISSIACAMADAYYGVPDELKKILFNNIDMNMNTAFITYKEFLQKQRDLHPKARCCIKRKSIL